MMEFLLSLICAEPCRGCECLVPTRGTMLTTCDQCWQEVDHELPFYEWVALDENRAFPVASGTAYDGLAKKLIYHLKYDNDRLIASDLATVLCKALTALRADIGDKPCLLVPVPLHWRRRWTRRFNQAELLATEMLKHIERERSASRAYAHDLYGMSAPVLASALLKRSRHTAAHHQLSREARLGNMQGAFSIGRLPRLSRNQENFLAACCVVLLDDIYTSGATMSEAARTLMDAGAGQVVGLSVARAILVNEAAGGSSET
jgi:ComF family protein